MLYKSFTLKKYSLPQKIIAGALAFGLIPLMGTADVSAKPSPNQDKIMKPAGWSCDAPYIACQPFSGGTGKVSFNYQGSSPGKIRVLLRMTAANLSNSPLIILMGIHSYPLRH